MTYSIQDLFEQQVHQIVEEYKMNPQGILSNTQQKINRNNEGSPKGISNSANTVNSIDLNIEKYNGPPHAKQSEHNVQRYLSIPNSSPLDYFLDHQAYTLPQKTLPQWGKTNRVAINNKNRDCREAYFGWKDNQNYNIVEEYMKENSSQIIENDVREDDIIEDIFTKVFQHQPRNTKWR